jgi:hypothetical protein
MITNTLSQGLKEGVYRFEVVSTPVQIDAKGFTKMEFELQPVGIESKAIKTSFFENQMAEILTALGCRQIDEGIFDWEPAEVFGKIIEARLSYEQDKNGKINEKTGKVVTYRRLSEFKAVEHKAINTPEAIAWEE